MKRFLALLVAILMMVIFVTCGSTGNTETKTETGRVYKCDYKTLNINTTVVAFIASSPTSQVGSIPFL